MILTWKISCTWYCTVLISNYYFNPVAHFSYRQNIVQKHPVLFNTSCCIFFITTPALPFQYNLYLASEVPQSSFFYHFSEMPIRPAFKWEYCSNLSPVFLNLSFFFFFWYHFLSYRLSLSLFLHVVHFTKRLPEELILDHLAPWKDYILPP